MVSEPFLNIVFLATWPAPDSTNELRSRRPTSSDVLLLLASLIMMTLMLGDDFEGEMMRLSAFILLY